MIRGRFTVGSFFGLFNTVNIGRNSHANITPR